MIMSRRHLVVALVLVVGCLAVAGVGRAEAAPSPVHDGETAACTGGTPEVARVAPSERAGTPARGGALGALANPGPGQWRGPATTALGLRLVVTALSADQWLDRMVHQVACAGGDDRLTFAPRGTSRPGYVWGPIALLSPALWLPLGFPIDVPDGLPPQSVRTMFGGVLVLGTTVGSTKTDKEAKASRGRGGRGSSVGMEEAAAMGGEESRTEPGAVDRKPISIQGTHYGFGEMLAAYREHRLNITQRALADRLGISPATMSRIERGEREAPSSRMNPQFHRRLREVVGPAVYAILMAAPDAPALRASDLPGEVVVAAKVPFTTPEQVIAVVEAQAESPVPGLTPLERRVVPVGSQAAVTITYWVDPSSPESALPIEAVREQLTEMSEDIGYHARQLARKAPAATHQLE
jgi:DNA-binding XRE family transcriptional regulator